jgi:DNA-binding NarL/FixJ family response regulator
MVSVAIFAEEPVVGIGFHTMLAKRGEFRPVAVFEDRSSLDAALPRFQPGLLLYAVRPADSLSDLPDAASVRLVLVARDASPDFAYRAFRLGAGGVLSGATSSATLHECLRAVSAGQTWVSPSIAAELCRLRTIPLSRRQGELLGLLVQGLKNRQIAAAMGLAESTVKAYLATLCEKTGAKDRFELVVMGLKNVKLGGGGFNELRISSATSPQ